MSWLIEVITSFGSPVYLQDFLFLALFQLCISKEGLTKEQLAPITNKQQLSAEHYLIGFRLLMDSIPLTSICTGMTTNPCLRQCLNLSSNDMDFLQPMRGIEAA
jgi:hypothetical protein